MKDLDKKIYTMISFIKKLDQGEGVYQDVLIHNMKTITGINVSGDDIKDFLKTDILTTGHDENNRETVLLSSGAQDYLDGFGDAWLKYPEMRIPYKSAIIPDSKKNMHRSEKKEGRDKLRVMKDPIAVLLLNSDTTIEKKKLSDYMHYLEKSIITSSRHLYINIDITNLEDGSCPICEKLYEDLKRDKKKRYFHNEHKHFLNISSDGFYVFYAKNKEYSTRTIKDPSGQRTVLVEVGKGDVELPKKTTIRHYLNIYRGNDFWKAAANLLKENNIFFADIYLEDEQLEEIREYFPEFNKFQSKQACPIGLDKEQCEAAWKETESIIYQKQKDIANAKLFLSTIYPEIIAKPKENEMIHIDMETFEDIHLMLQEGHFEKKNRRGSKEELKWYDYFYTVENNDGILIDVPSYLKDKKEEGKTIHLDDIKICLFKKKIEAIYQTISN